MLPFIRTNFNLYSKQESTSQLLPLSWKKSWIILVTLLTFDRWSLVNFVNIDFGLQIVFRYVVDDPFYQDKRLTHFFKLRDAPFKSLLSISLFKNVTSEWIIYTAMYSLRGSGLGGSYPWINFYFMLLLILIEGDFFKLDTNFQKISFKKSLHSNIETKYLNYWQRRH